MRFRLDVEGRTQLFRGWSVCMTSHSLPLRTPWQTHADMSQPNNCSDFSTSALICFCRMIGFSSILAVDLVLLLLQCCCSLQSATLLFHCCVSFLFLSQLGCIYHICVIATCKAVTCRVMSHIEDPLKDLDLLISVSWVLCACFCVWVLMDPLFNGLLKLFDSDWNTFLRNTKIGECLGYCLRYLLILFQWELRQSRLVLNF